MELPAKIAIDLIYANTAYYDPQSQTDERKFVVRLTMEPDRSSPYPLVGLADLFDEWFADEGRTAQGEDLAAWVAEQTAMESFLEGQLQRLRKRLIRRGHFPSQ